MFSYLTKPNLFLAIERIVLITLVFFIFIFTSLFAITTNIHAGEANSDDNAETVDFSDFTKSPDQHGLGIGISSLSSTGAFLFYDYNLHSRSKQIHIQVDSGSDSRSTLLGQKVAELTQSDLTISFRHVFPRGWYAGFGAGLYKTTLFINQDSYSETPAQNLEFFHSGYLWSADFGWQGNEFYYFHIGFRLGGLMKNEEYYAPNLIYDIANHRVESANLWESGNRYDAIMLGFGWYIEPLDQPKVTNKAPKQPREEVLNKAKRCQEKGGVWIDDSCHISIE